MSQQDNLDRLNESRARQEEAERVERFAEEDVRGVFLSVLDEVERATKKFPTWPTDPIHALAVLQEEVGELSKEVLQLTYEPHKTSRETVRKEAIQAAAMAIRFLLSLETYEYVRSEQHLQEP